MRRKFDAKLFDNPPRPSAGYALYFDAKTTGLAMRVPAKGTPTLQVVARNPAGRERRVTFAKVIPHGAMAEDGRTLDLDAIRAAAVAVREKIRLGENPNNRPAKSTEHELTLAAAVEIHIDGKTAAGKLQPASADEYRRHVQRYFQDWQTRPLASLTRLEVHARHKAIAEAHGPYAANAAFRTLRAAYRRAERLHPNLPKCPVDAIEWFEERRRDPGLREHDLPLIAAKIRSLSNPVRRDYYEFVLFTGMRRTAAASAKTEDLDLKRGVLFVPTPKGGAKRQFELPLSDYVVDLLGRRAVENHRAAPASPYLFPANSASGYIAEPRDNALGFSPNSLRHIFATVAGTAGLQLYQIKLLTNHRLPKLDVTLGYMWPSAEQLRPSANLVANRILLASQRIGSKQLTKFA